jgi:hypothetical protein
MQRKLLSILFLAFLSLLVTACGGSLFAPPTPTPTSIPIPTLTPTDTPSPTSTPTNTPFPTKTPVPPTLTATPDLPQGTPVSEWQGIPIMPGAISGDGDEFFYEFITNASQDEVRDYYIKTMPEYGWKYEQTMPDGPGKYIFILPNDKGGYIIYLGSPFDFMYVYEEGGFTHVEILYTP